MAADPSIFSALLGQPKSAAQYASEYQGVQQNALQALLGQQQLKTAQQAEKDDAALRSYLSSNPDLSTPQAQAGLYQAAPKAAGAILKTRAEVDKEQRQAEQARAAAAETEAKRKREQLGFVLNAVSAAKDPTSYASSLNYLRANGVDITGIPEQYDPAFVAHAGQQAMTAVQRMEAEDKARTFKLKSFNEMIFPDGTRNEAFIGAKREVAKAGASNISMNSGQKGLDNEFKLRGEFRSEPVYKAHQEMQSAYAQIKQSINQASPAGDLAAATKIMKLLDPGSVVRESELGMAMQASGLLDRVTSFVPNILSGQKLTPQQRKDFRKLADALYSTSVEQFNSKRLEYDKLGSEYGLNSGRALGPNASTQSTGGFKYLGKEGN